MPETPKKQTSKKAKKEEKRIPRLSKAQLRAKLIAESKRRRGKDLFLGRPTKYDPDFCFLVLEMAESGASNEKIMTAIGCSKPTFYAWTRAHPEFLNAVKQGKIARLAWWEDVQQGQAAGKIKGNGSVANFVVENISASVDETESKPYRRKIEFDGRTEVVTENKDVDPEDIAKLSDEKKRAILEALDEDKS